MQNKSSQVNLAFADEGTQENDSKNDETLSAQDIDFKHLEGGYGWIVLIVAILYYGFCLSAWTNFTLIYPKMIEFHKDENNHVTFVAWVGSLFFGISFLLASLSSFLVDFFGCIKMGFIGGLLSTIGLIMSALFLTFKISILYHFISYSIIFGVGTSLIMTVPYAILPHYFKKKLGFVNGLLNAGASVILLGYSYLVGYLLDNFELQITFYAIAGTSVLLALSSFIFKPQLPCDKESLTLKKQLVNSLGLEILKKPKFIIWSVSLIFGALGNATPIMGHYCALNFPAYRPEILNMSILNEPKTESLNKNLRIYLNIVYGISNGLASIGIGKLMDHTKFSKAYNYLMASLAYGIATWLIRFINNFYVYCVVILVYGLFDAFFICSMMPMAYEVSNGSSKLVNQALGYCNTFMSFSVVLGPTISGYFFEKYNDYIISYDITVGTLIVSSLIIAFYPDLFLFNLLRRIKNKICQIRSDKLEMHFF